MRISRASLRIVLVVSLGLAGLRTGAQTPGTGAIAGTVMDATGAVIALAGVHVVNEDTKAARAVATAPDGTFRVSLLQPGMYSVSVEAQNFQTKQFRGVHIVGSETSTMEAVLRTLPRRRARRWVARLTRRRFCLCRWQIVTIRRSWRCRRVSWLSCRARRRWDVIRRTYRRMETRRRQTIFSSTGSMRTTWHRTLLRGISRRLEPRFLRLT